MAEWFKRGTVNTFYRGSNPLKAYLNKKNSINIYTAYTIFILAAYF
jgi:hypothetical protein